MKFRFIGSKREGMKPGDIYSEGGRSFLVTRDEVRLIQSPPPSEIDRGPQGPPGESIVGPAGESIVGPAGHDGQGFTYRGRWKRETSYVVNDVCSHDGQTFVCVSATSFAEPGVRKKNWSLLAARGARGPQGESGWSMRGPRGFQGTSGGGGSVTMEAIFDSNTLKGQVVYISGDGHVDLAQANAGATATAVGIAIQDVTAGQSGEYIPVGPVSCETWSLTPGTVYYLDPSTLGGMTATYPTTPGHFVVILGAASTPTQLNTSIHWMLEHE